MIDFHGFKSKILEKNALFTNKKNSYCSGCPGLKGSNTAGEKSFLKPSLMPNPFLLLWDGRTVTKNNTFAARF